MVHFTIASFTKLNFRCVQKPFQEKTFKSDLYNSTPPSPYMHNTYILVAQVNNTSNFRELRLLFLLRQQLVYWFILFTQNLDSTLLAKIDCLFISLYIVTMVVRVSLSNSYFFTAHKYSELALYPPQKNIDAEITLKLRT